MMGLYYHKWLVPTLFFLQLIHISNSFYSAGFSTGTFKQANIICSARSGKSNLWRYDFSQHHRNWALSQTTLSPKEEEQKRNGDASGVFDLTSALFCAGLAFDAYAEPNANSPRWERGSRGTNVAFQSASFAKSLYRGIVEIVLKNCTDLPDEDDNVQSLLSGGGVDPYLLTAVVEGDAVSSDVQTVAERFSGGVVDLKSSAHLARSKTAWSNVNEKQAKENAEKNRLSAASNYSTGYYVSSSWGKGGQAVWLNEPPLYLYVREPSSAFIVCTLMDEDVYSQDDVIGSVSIKLADIFPKGTFAKSNADLVDAAKKIIMENLSELNAKKLQDKTSFDTEILNAVVQQWEGVSPLKSKPKKKDKKGQIAVGAAAGAFVAGPVGAAVGGLLGSFFEENVRGKLALEMRYLPIPTIVMSKRKKYEVKGGIPGVSWGQLYKEHLKKIASTRHSSNDIDLAGDDLEFCAFVTNEETGCSCALYRSLEKRMIAVSFRGTCAPKDLVTDVSILQTTWVEGENEEKEGTLMVHGGFRTDPCSCCSRRRSI